MSRPKSEFITAERWRVEKMVDELMEMAYHIREGLSDEIREALRLGCASHEEVHAVQRATVQAVLEFAEQHAIITTDGRHLSPCPLCGDTRQDGHPFLLPTGLERHLEGKGQSRGCVVLHFMERASHYMVNMERGNPFRSFMDGD